MGMDEFRNRLLDGQSHLRFLPFDAVFPLFLRGRLRFDLSVRNGRSCSPS